MEYIKSFFGKSPEQLTYKDVENYFQLPRKESNILEYKSFNARHGSIEQKLDAIYKVICSFLNSEGGLLIWGAPEEDKSDKENSFSRALSPVTNYFSRDFLINKISDSITPMPNGIRVFPIENNGNLVYLIEVDQSEFSPHQTGNMYYVRIDGQKRPAPHYYIEALFRKIKYPNLGGYVKLNSFKEGRNLHSGKMILNLTVFILNHSKLQNEQNVFYTLMCDDGIFVLPSEYPQRISLSFEDHQLRDECLSEILPYGAAPYYNVNLFFTTEILFSTEKTTKLILNFGGKYSPMKVSNYELNLAKSNWKNPNEFITYRRENILIHELADVPLTESERVNALLGR